MGIEVLAVGQEEQDKYDAQKAELANNNGTNENLSTSPEVTDAPAVDKGQEANKPDAVEQKDEVKDEPAEDADLLYFGDVPVEVEVPAEISEALKGAKIDEAALLKELFAKDGKFEVSEKTKDALDKAFGKTMVDGYLGLFRQQNQQSLDGFKKEAADTAASMKANGEDFDKLVGGDDGWSKLAEWAGENMSEQELSQFNAVMQLDGKHYQAQRAVVEALQIKHSAHQQKLNGDPSVTLPTDEGSGAHRSTDSLPETLTKAQAQEIWRSERYKKDPKYAEAVDNIRRASQKRGIK
ncbi:MAG: hypothetical protein [Bacteriophage sp.]|nr:MAG: hypothetical protein [Bacteriophage sp.]